ncbi:hypothetical protein ABID19_006480 [Mesorhizobium robiniae]|uniref:Uncharacterized protein n=1 Tax=Mesorhizobium robiniae TaxID=559315 RepID=A0ABV2GYP3_9HYPH|nr:hypothetical protein [Mesorhizobium sp. ZC-5]MCV3243936.1 hypothetical protein [Mesorhizobium sp. ZC-5]
MLLFAISYILQAHTVKPFPSIAGELMQRNSSEELMRLSSKANPHLKQSRLAATPLPTALNFAPKADR